MKAGSYLLICSSACATGEQMISEYLALSLLIELLRYCHLAHLTVLCYLMVEMLRYLSRRRLQYSLVDRAPIVPTMRYTLLGRK